MTEFLKYTLDLIRHNSASMSWLEDKRLELAPLLFNRLKLLIQDGRTFIFVSDDNRLWYEEYFLQNINSKSNRPLIPFFSLNSLCKRQIKNNEDISLVNDLLEITFPNGFVYFYVGLSASNMANIAKSRSDSFFIVFDDEHVQNSLFINQQDVNLDSKLISFYNFFDSLLDAILLSKVNI